MRFFLFFLISLLSTNIFAQSRNYSSESPESYTGMVTDFHAVESIFKDANHPELPLDFLSSIRNQTKGLKATVERSNFSFCSAKAKARYGIRRYTNTTSFPNLRKWERAEVKDNDNDFVSFIFVMHDYGEAIICKRFDDTGDSFEINMKLCTTADDPITGLSRSENPAAVCTWMRR